jgi:hypothetical protein
LLTGVGNYCCRFLDQGLELLVSFIKQTKEISLCFLGRVSQFLFGTVDNRLPLLNQLVHHGRLGRFLLWWGNNLRVATLINSRNAFGDRYWVWRNQLRLSLLVGVYN